MFPVLGEHSLVLCQKTNFYDSLQVGDIIIFEKDEQRVIHRIIRKSMDEQGSYVVTKGDNNMRSDLNSFGKIREDQIRGVVIGILY
jgi:signal peptidase I